MTKRIIAVLFFLLMISTLTFAEQRLYTDDDLDSYRSAPPTKEDIKLQREREADMRRYIRERDQAEADAKQQEEAKRQKQLDEIEKRNAEYRAESQQWRRDIEDRQDRRQFQNDLLNSIDSLRQPPRVIYLSPKKK